MGLMWLNGPIIFELNWDDAPQALYGRVPQQTAVQHYPKMASVDLLRVDKTISQHLMFSYRQRR